MSEHKEKLSAFLDDALERHEVDLLEQEGEESTLAHYSLIGDALRGQVDEASLVDVSRSVHRAIAEAGGSAVAVGRSIPVEQNARASWFDLSSWLRPAGGLAIAASVAMVVVVALDESDDAGIGGARLTADSAPAAPAAKPPVMAATTDAPARKLAAGAQQPVQTINLDQYLDAHSEFAASDTLQGRLPYVRAVGYKSK